MFGQIRTWVNHRNISCVTYEIGACAGESEVRRVARDHAANLGAHHLGFGVAQWINDPHKWNTCHLVRLLRLYLTGQSRHAT